MCGYYYSSDGPLKDIDNLKRRGPDEWREHSTHNEHFGAARLTTMVAATKQPAITEKGTLLYNGSVYNNIRVNDTKWITDQLSDRVDDNISVVRSLLGEYSLTWVTDQHVIFCTDIFGMRPLYYYYEEDLLCVASLSDCINSRYKKFYRCHENLIYIYNKTTKKLSTVKNMSWNTRQTVANYDRVWELWEKAITDRHTEQTSILMSSGYDSGIIACTAKKFNKDIDCYYIYNENEDNQVVKDRTAIHNVTTIDLKLDHGDPEAHEKFFNTTCDNKYLRNNRFGNTGNTEIFTKHMKPKGKRILLGGDGGDDVYSDYGFHGQRLREHSRFGGHFPKYLENIWPWTESNVFRGFHNRTEIVGGYWGIEYRCPLMSTELIQAWLNTTSDLKNREHKGWMAQYMRDHNYPYSDLEKIGPRGKIGNWHPVDRRTN